jgi:DNA processing protein
MSAPLLAPSDVIALSFVPHLPREAARSPEAHARLEDLLTAIGCPDVAATAGAARARAASAVGEAARRGIVAVAWGDERYPRQLAAIVDPPFVLWARGAIDLLQQPQVAIVGSRAASSYGEEAAARLASDLVSRGFVVTSGLARGIDAAAHRGALVAGGPTVAVLGCGTDVVYPAEHLELIREVAAAGTVVSELPPGTPPLRHHFPRRNRIISGLSLGVVVVEASERSGSLITADCALEQGREVMAVPGNVLSDRHRGSHRLLKEGAALVESADDVLDALGLFGWPTAGHAGPPAAGGEGADALLAHLDRGEGRDLDALARASGLDASALLTRLLQLELQGRVRRLPGGRFMRADGNVLT